MATARTKLTELGTAVGLVDDGRSRWPEALDVIEVPGIADDVWRPVVEPAARSTGPDRDLLLRAVGNGRAFRSTVLRGRRPECIEWTGGTRSVWTSDIPRDLTVDGVWFIQAKYGSHCVLNTSPGALVDDLLVDHSIESRQSWFEEVALPQLQALYEQTRVRLPLANLPDDVRDLDKDAKTLLKQVAGAAPSPSEERAYHELCRAVSIETTLRWRHRLAASTLPQRTQMLFRMLRIAGGPYWLLGTTGAAAVQRRVMDTRTWRDRFDLKRFDVTDAHAGQPQVNWRAVVVERDTKARHVIDGCCEIRWSHGRLQGNPECKVQVTTPLTQLPGYEPMR